MVLTSGIEQSSAIRTLIGTHHVLLYGQFSAAGSAKDCGTAPVVARPDFDRVIGERNMTIFASVINPAAIHLDGDDVSGSMIVFTPGLRI